MANYPRTPRKEKSFFRSVGSIAIDETESGVKVGVDLLADYKSDLGITEVRNLTVMDMRIKVDIYRSGSTTFTQIMEFASGICWLPASVTTVGDLPDPSAQGLRETRWIHKWDQSLLNDTVAQARPGDNRFGQPNYQARTRNAAKQPSARHNLTLITVPFFSVATADQNCVYNYIVEGMLALP